MVAGESVGRPRQEYPLTLKTTTMSFEKVLSQLEAWGLENVRQMYARHGAGDNQFGVTLGNLRGLAKKLKTNHELALQLWGTGNADAMILGKIEAEILSAPKRKQESMNRCLVEIGCRVPGFTQKCLDLGERLGRFDKTTVPKGCISSYAPEWIAAVLKRKK